MTERFSEVYLINPATDDPTGEYIVACQLLNVKTGKVLVTRRGYSADYTTAKEMAFSAAVADLKDRFPNLINDFDKHFASRNGVAAQQHARKAA